MIENKKFSLNLLIMLSTLFILLSVIGLYLGARYINRKLLQSGQAVATDIALLVKNNFSISDQEVDYMKSLSFNEMEIDPINYRLMNIGNGVLLNAEITNVYILSPLSIEEYRFCTTKDVAKFLGYTIDTPLNAIWLLNGKINDKGQFEPAQRDDIFRYTAMDKAQQKGMDDKQAFGTFSKDIWGNFITGYAPVYSVECNFVGLLGIDMEPDIFQACAQKMIFLIISLFILLMIIFSVLLIFFFTRYSAIQEADRNFNFFSNMSHEIRNPLNGIIGMSSLSKEENNVFILHRNLSYIESSSKRILQLVDCTLDYKKKKIVEIPKYDSNNYEHKSIWSSLFGKRILLCEDIPMNAEITRRILQRVSCHIDIAENGKIGLDMFVKSEIGYYDAILMDIRMPVMNGIEATKKIRLLNRKDAVLIPIIAVTANSYEEDIEVTKKAGMNDHLTKPVSPYILYNSLLKAIKNQTK